jgi:SAM-dependent methyltransferase
MRRKSFLLSIFGGAANASLIACSKIKRPSLAASHNSSGTEQLADRIIKDTNAAYFVAAAYIGDRLGLFKAMSDAGPLAADRLAKKTGLNERYVLEWLRTMAAAHYLDYRPESNAFEIPTEHISVLVNEDSPTFSMGLVEGTVPDILMVPQVLAAFRTGKGIPYGDYPAETFDAIERITKPDYRHRLTQRWLPSVPGIADRLSAGGVAADLGSGAGHASIAIAQAFPKARAVGFEPYAPSVARARENARALGLSERVKFETFDGVHVPAGPYDLITINHSLHHAGEPLALLRSARQALTADGVFFIVEERRSARLEQDINLPRGGYYGIGLLECLPTALAEGGPGYGTGITEQDVRKLAASAGFHDVTRIMPEDPMLSFFVLRA